MDKKNLDATRTTSSAEIYVASAHHHQHHLLLAAVAVVTDALALVLGNTSPAFDQLFGASILTADRRG